MDDRPKIPTTGIYVEPDRVMIRKALFLNLRGLLAFLLIFSMLAAILLVIKRQSNNISLLNKVNNTNNILIDCTTPGHKCYQDNITNTQKLVQELNTIQKDVIIATVYCKAQGNVTIPALTTCIDSLVH